LSSTIVGINLNWDLWVIGGVLMLITILAYLLKPSPGIGELWSKAVDEPLA
jgi:hypothetical protein